MTDRAPRRRVLWLIKGLGPGGAERLLVEHAAAADHDAFEYEVVYLLEQKQHLVGELAARGVPARGLGVRNELDPRWIPRLHHHLRTGCYDVVHAHSPVPASAARVLARALPRARRPRLVYTEHNRWPSHHPATRVANEATFPLDDADLAVSQEVRDSIPARLRARVEVVVHGVDVDAVRSERACRAATRDALGVAPDDVLVVTVANLRANKNYPGLLAAARLAADRVPALRFAAAGQGPLEDEVRALHAASGLGDRFRLLGYRTDTTRLVAAADLYVLASHHEGLPVTVMEALTLGVPVVAPAVGGLPEVVETGVDGILVPPDDPPALARAIEDAAAPGRRAALAAGARATGDRFSSRAAVARIEAVYRGR